MIGVVTAPDLYTYIPFDPPSLEALQNRYRKWEPRISPDKDEIWLNWVIRLKSEDRYIGDLQAGYKDDKAAYIAYMLHPDYQHRGFTTESVRALLDFLFDQLSMVSVRAYIDTRNQQSIALVQRVGMVRVDFLPRADHFKGSDSDEFVFEVTPETRRHTA